LGSLPLEENPESTKVPRDPAPPRTLAERAVRLFVSAIRLLPYKALWKAGIVLGTLAFHLLRDRRRTALSNLDLAYGDSLGPAEKKRIARLSFVNLVTTALEFCYSPALVGPTDRILRVEGTWNLYSAYRKGKGLIFLVPHSGNWEIAGRFFHEHGIVTHVVVRRQKQAWLTRLVSEIRVYHGLVEIDKKNALKSVLAALRRGEAVGMLIDQHARNNALETTFFGRPAMTTASAALLALKTDCPVLLAGCYRFPNGFHGGFFSEVLETIRTGDREADLLANTQNYVTAIEGHVRKHPESWLWMHRRWKTAGKKERKSSSPAPSGPNDSSDGVRGKR